MMRSGKIVFVSCLAVLAFLLTIFSSGRCPAQEELKPRVKNCITCCEKKFLTCINLNPDRRLCASESENCVVTCKSEGIISSGWGECWTRSKGDDAGTEKKDKP